MLAVYMVYICIEIMTRYSFKSYLAAMNFNTNWLVSNFFETLSLTASNSSLVKTFQWLMLPTANCHCIVSPRLKDLELGTLCL